MADAESGWVAQLRKVFSDLSEESEASRCADTGKMDLAQELAEERAAIIEFDAGFSRERAEDLAGIKRPGR